MTETTKSCINCGHSVDSKFCPNCGQPQQIARISFKTLFQDFQNKLFGFDTRFFRTIKDMAVQPGKTIDTFLAGNRMRYTPPFSFFLLVITIWLLLYQVFDIDMRKTMEEGFQAGLQVQNGPATEDQKAFAEKLISTITANMRIYTILFIPCIAFFSRLYFSKMKRNFMEWMAITLYIVGVSHVFNIFEVAIYALGASNINIYVNIIIFIYMIYAYIKIVHTSGPFKVGILTILNYLCSYFVYIIIMTIVTVSIIVLFP